MQFVHRPARPGMRATRALPSAAWRRVLVLATAVCGLAGAAPAQAEFSAAGGTGKLLLTGGVSSIDGAAGGGLTPWAVTGSYASDGQVGGTAHLTRVRTQDYGLTAYGSAVSVKDVLELSIAHQDFDTGPTGVALAMPGLHLGLTIVGAKVKVAGDAVLDSDTLFPQVAVGLEYKMLADSTLTPVLASLGARDHGMDAYVSATKLFLARSLLVNATLRATTANQNGLLGFAGTAHPAYSLQPEFSVACLLSKRVAVGAEYRFKPDNLDPSALGDALKEDNWLDAFVAWAPSKNLSFTLAWVDLGRIVPGFVPKRQSGAYLSAQVAF